MKPRIVNLIAVLALAGLPAALPAATAATAPVELHIQASAQVPPDRALLAVTLRGNGTSQAAAEAELAGAEAALKARLAAARIDPAKVQLKADEAASIDNLSATVVPSDDAATAAYDAAEAAAAAAGDAAARSKPKSRKRSVQAASDEYLPPRRAPRVNVSKAYVVEIDDLAKLEQLASLGELDPYAGRLRPVFSTSDPAASRRKARELALAKARKEADETAAAMGYRVVRMVRVSNARPQVNMQDMFDFISMIDNRSTTMQPSFFASTTFETVAIDYLMVPK